MGNRRQRNNIKWSDFVEHSKVAGVDMDKAKFSSEAREIGSKLYKVVHRAQREDKIEWSVMRDALYLTLIRASAASKQEAD